MEIKTLIETFSNLSCFFKIKKFNFHEYTTKCLK